MSSPEAPVPTGRPSPSPATQGPSPSPYIAYLLFAHLSSSLHRCHAAPSLIFAPILRHHCTIVLLLPLAEMMLILPDHRQQRDAAAAARACRLFTMPPHVDARTPRSRRRRPVRRRTASIGKIHRIECTTSSLPRMHNNLYRITIHITGHASLTPTMTYAMPYNDVPPQDISAF